MIEKQHNRKSKYDTYDISCDFCSTGEEQYEVDDWSELIASMKEDGWKISKDGDEWQHECPDCVRDSDDN